MKNAKRHQVTITFDVDVPTGATLAPSTFRGIAAEIREDFSFVYFHGNNNNHDRYMDEARPKNVKVEVKKPKK